MAEREVEAAAENACDWNTGKLCLIPIPASLEKPDFSLLHAPNCQPCGTISVVSYECNGVPKKRSDTKFQGNFLCPIIVQISTRKQTVTSFYKVIRMDLFTRDNCNYRE